ncbi:hypothetical protein PILCRDRAFT_637882 [Piloderma croceum F 1598]|uniref:Uncharacterized protein n=1 Tax=Piloderma croceum (strain F 1598) TaxID=765440 RepID=A0A0C3FA83_PILCF|nr:hypothetical protein PILCRDRAFT_637882 [Piloderma croceum F 1598]
MQEAGDSSSIQYISTGTSCILYNASRLPPDDRQGSTADHNLVSLNVTKHTASISSCITIHVLYVHPTPARSHNAWLWALFRFQSSRLSGLFAM